MLSARSLGLLFLFFLAFTAFTHAQQNTDFPTLTSSGSDQTTATSESSATSDATTSNTDSSNTASATDSSNTSGSTTSDARTTTDSSSSTGSTSGPPSLTSSSGTSLVNPNLPTLSGVLPPPLQVPNTADAPYMQKSNLPEGTVFIAVGATLAVLGAAVIAWRGMVAYSLHRSVQRAANAAYISDSKSMFPFGDTKGQYKTLHDPSTLSLEQLSNIDTAYGGGGQVRDRSSHKPKHETRRTPTSSNLFFSPTGAGMQGPTKNVSSSHLPSGYYAAGSSTLNSGDLISHLGGGPTASGYNRVGTGDAGNVSPSPPDSPGMHPTMRPSSGHLSSANPSSRQSREHRRSRLGSSDGTLNVAAPPQGRAPSAYLENLMDSHGFGPRERF